MDDNMEEINNQIKNINISNIGFSDLINVFEFSVKDVKVKKIGGGYFFCNHNKENFDFIHIIPHGGASFPKWCLDFTLTNNPYKIAELIVNNNDTYTTTIAKEIVNAIKISRYSICVAYFDISRVLIDSNRRLKENQMYGGIYKGKQIFTIEDLIKIRKRLRENYLLPWTKEVNFLIKSNPNAFIFHHHTFDIRGAKNLPHDKKPFELRPSSQLFRQKPVLGSNKDNLDYKGVFIKEKNLNKIIYIFKKYLNEITTNVKVEIDNPLIAPILPFTGCTSSRKGKINHTPKYSHIIYELRKDIFKEFNDLKMWIDCITEIQSELKIMK